MVQDSEIWQLVHQAPSIERAAQDLVERARANGGEDNITVIIVAFEPDGNIQPAGNP